MTNIVPIAAGEESLNLNGFFEKPTAGEATVSALHDEKVDRGYDFETPITRKPNKVPTVGENEPSSIGMAAPDMDAFLEKITYVLEKRFSTEISSLKNFFEGKFSMLEGKIADKFSILEGKIYEKFSILQKKLDLIVEQKICNVATHEDERKNDKLVSEKGKDNDNFDVLLDAVEGRIFHAEGNEEEEIRATATDGKQFYGQNKENK